MVSPAAQGTDSVQDSAELSIRNADIRNEQDLTLDESVYDCMVRRILFMHLWSDYSCIIIMRYEARYDRGQIRSSSGVGRDTWRLSERRYFMEACIRFEFAFVFTLNITGLFRLLYLSKTSRDQYDAVADLAEAMSDFLVMNTVPVLTRR